jgi:uncharacterized protein (DUF1501 family)
MTMPHAPSRRELLLAPGVLFAWAYLPREARAEGRDPRFLVVVLRGALDGLAAVAPAGDPDWVALRGANALRLDGPTPSLPLDRMFVLNPAMPNLHRLYRAGEAAIVHAVATPYRERSHFDGQDVLESGLAGPGVTDSGWLNRALAAIEPGGRVDASGAAKAFAVGPVTPLVARGPAPVLSWTPPRLEPAGEDTLTRLLDLYRHTDPPLARALEERIGIAAIAGAGGMETGPGKKPPAAQLRGYFAESAASAVRFMARPDGPRVGALAFDGWDTHANEGAVNGRLAGLLGALDGAIAAIETGMGPAWRDTVVAVATEFGRTARPRHRHDRAARRRRRQGRPRHRRLAGPEGGEPAPEARPQADDRSPRRAQGRVARPFARAGNGTRRESVSGQHRRQGRVGPRRRWVRGFSLRTGAGPHSPPRAASPSNRRDGIGGRAGAAADGEWRRGQQKIPAKAYQLKVPVRAAP